MISVCRQQSRVVFCGVVVLDSDRAVDADTASTAFPLEAKPCDRLLLKRDTDRTKNLSD